MVQLRMFEAKPCNHPVHLPLGHIAGTTRRSRFELVPVMRILLGEGWVDCFGKVKLLAKTHDEVKSLLKALSRLLKSVCMTIGA